MAHYIFFFLSSLLTLVAFQGIQAVEYQVTNNAASTPGGTIFQNQIGVEYARQTMAASTDFIWNLFQQTTDVDRKPVQKVSLEVVPSLNPGIVAGTSGDVIRFSAEYIKDRPGFAGVLYHEMTHVWQWDGKAAGAGAPGWVIEGVADFVRLKAGLAPSSGWAAPGEGNSWTDSYSVTARFFDYCDGLRNGFVAELNKRIRGGYDENYFVQLLGKPVEQLWSDYKAKYGH